MKITLFLCLVALTLSVQGAAPSKLFIFLTGQSQAAMFYNGETTEAALASTDKGLVSLVKYLKELNPSMDIQYKMEATGSTPVSSYHNGGGQAYVNDLSASFSATSLLNKTVQAMTDAARQYGSDYHFLVLHYAHSQDAQSSRWDANKYIGSLSFMMNSLRNAALRVQPSLSGRYWHGFQLHGSRGVNTHGDKIRTIALAMAGRGSYPNVSPLSWAKLLNGGMMAVTLKELGIENDSQHFPRSTNLRLARELAVHISRQLGGQSPASRFCEVDSVTRVDSNTLQARVVHTAGKRLVVKKADFFVHTTTELGGTRLTPSGFSVVKGSSGITYINLDFASALPTGNLYVSYGVGSNIGMYTPEKESIYEDLTSSQDLVIHKDLRDLLRSGSKMVSNSMLPLFDMKVSSISSTTTSGSSTTGSSTTGSSTTGSGSTTGSSTTGSSSATYCTSANEFKVAQLTCTSSQPISIVSAFYGTPSSCPSPSSGTCNSNNASAVVKSLCNGKASCSVLVTNDYFGEPCFNIAKYLVVSYKCGSSASTSGSSTTGPVSTTGSSTTTGSPVSTVCTTANEFKTASLSCSGKSISITTAYYGTPTSCPTPSAGTCNSANAGNIVKSACNGKSSCSVLVNKATFGEDPCVNTPKYLAVSYTCG